MIQGPHILVVNRLLKHGLQEVFLALSDPEEMIQSEVVQTNVSGSTFTMRENSA
jgi:hypothetical protein